MYLLFSVAIIVTEDNLLEKGLNLLEKQLIYNSNSLLCFDHTAENTQSYKHAVTF